MQQNETAFKLKFGVTDNILYHDKLPDLSL